MALSFYILDSETTGLKAGHHEVTELSIIRVSDRVQLTRNIKAEFPDRANPEALRITNKTKESICQGFKKEEAIKIFNNFLQEDGLTPDHRCIVAHNKSFDQRFCHALWGSAQETFSANLWVCTMEMTKQFAKSKAIIKPKVNLASCLEMFKIAKVNRQHNSKDDCINTFLLWQRLLEEKTDYINLIKRIPHIRDSHTENEIDII